MTVDELIRSLAGIGQLPQNVAALTERITALEAAVSWQAPAGDAKRDVHDFSSMDRGALAAEAEAAAEAIERRRAQPNEIGALLRAVATELRRRP